MLIEAGWIASGSISAMAARGSRPPHGRHPRGGGEGRRACRRVRRFAGAENPRLGRSRAGSQARFNEIVTLEASTELGGPGLIRLPHPEIVQALEEGDILKLDDGKLQITVTEVGRTQLKARVDFGGVLKNQKGLNVPTRRIPISALTEKDREDLAYALDLGVDYIALSFVQHPEDVREARELIGDRAGIISKIEKPSALQQIDEIVELSDAVMVARGDLGVELPPEQCPSPSARSSAPRAAGKP